MATRRAFLRQAGAAGLAVGTLPTTSWASEKKDVLSARPTLKGGERIKSIVRRDETTVQSGGYGTVTGTTWTGDDRLLVGVIEGMEWPGQPLDLHFQSALIEVSGAPEEATFSAITGYPVLSTHNWFRPGGDPLYYGNGMLAVDATVFRYLSSYHGTAYWGLPLPHEDPVQMPSLKCTKLIYSTDYGRTWRNQDGTQPVYFEQPKDQDKTSMIFWDEPRGLFNTVQLLQMGKGYCENRDGYVYGYSMVSKVDAEELAMFRVSKKDVLSREQYEFFSGLRANGSANWTKEIQSCAAVHSFPRNWGSGSLVYNAPLRQYMMTASYFKVIDDLTDTAEPSSLGLWVAPQPWGPWEQVYDESPWIPTGQGGFIGGTQIPSKWISDDGKSFWITWFDWSKTSEITPDAYEKIWFASGEKDYRDKLHTLFLAHSNFRFNRQRVDLVMG